MLAVLTASSFVIGSMTSETLMGVVLVGWIGIYSVLVVRNFRALMLIGMVAVIPLRLNYFLATAYTDFPRPIHGFAISAEDFCLLGLLFYLLFQVFIRRERTLHMPARVLWPALIYLALGFFACMKAQTPLLQVCTFLAVVRSLVFFFLLANYLRSDNDVILFLLGLFSIVVLESLLGGMQLLCGGMSLEFMPSPGDELQTNITGSMEFARISGTMGSANLYALFLNLGLVVAFGLFVSRIGAKYLWLRLIALGVICVALPMDILSYSRGAWMALGIAVVWFSVHILHYYTKSLLKSLLLVTVCGAIICSAGLSIDSVRERLLGEDYGSIEMRVPMMTVASEIIMAHPLTGVGYGEYTASMAEYNKTPYNLGSDFTYPVHNFLFLLAAEGGIPALIAFLFLFFGVCSYAFKFLKRSVLDKEPFLPFVGAGMVFSLVALMIQCQLIVYNTYAELSFWLLFGAIVAIDYIISHRQEEADPQGEGGALVSEGADRNREPPLPGILERGQRPLLPLRWVPRLVAVSGRALLRRKRAHTAADVPARKRRPLFLTRGRGRIETIRKRNEALRRRVRSARKDSGRP